MIMNSVRRGRADTFDRQAVAAPTSPHAAPGNGRFSEGADRDGDAAFVRDVVDQAPVMVFAVDTDGIITFASGGLVEAMGLRNGEVVGLHLETVYPDAPDVADRFKRALDGEESRTVARHGDWNLEVWYRAYCDDDGTVVGVIGIASEINESYRALALHSHQTSVLHRILHGTSLEESLRAIHLLVETSASDLRCDLLIPDPLLPASEGDADWTLPVLTDHGAAVGSLVGRPGTPRPPSSEERSVLALAARLAGIVVERDHSRQHDDAVLHDALTGLPGRAQLLDTLEGMVGAGVPPSLLFCNIDRFKLINESLGPEFGDRVLSAVAARLRSTVREVDLVARVGGDEFVILLTGIMASGEVEEMARRVLARVTAPMAINGRHLLTTVSIGVAVPHADDTAVDLLSRGDVAMSRAKERGRERYVVQHRTAEGNGALRRLEIETGIRFALERDELCLHFQPIVRCDNGQTASLEALIRWQHPDHGVVGPGAFLPVAKDAGLINAIDRWVLREACRQVATCRDMSTAPSRPVVSVNFAGMPFDEAHLVAHVLEYTAAAGLLPEQLIIEVTEEMLAAEEGGAVSAFERLRGHGVRIAIDDFGTGYSSLHRLKSLPVDVLKVDRSFVEGLGEEPEASALLDAIVTMGHALGMEIVAEGVETAAQLDEVKRLGCDMAQGYYFARPAPLDEL
jgi:diguanylate cyclase (GGDEF)-like protein/PAS domain S-box-containing protein